MKSGLYDVLRGRFYDGTPFSASVSDRQQRLKSILGNLDRLFNTRQGSLPHLPDYGLPEAVAIYRDAEYPIDRMRKDIREAVEKYEPRLIHPRVERQPDADDHIRLAFLITAELSDGGHVRLQTTVSTNDLVHVDPVTRAD